MSVATAHQRANKKLTISEQITELLEKKQIVIRKEQQARDVVQGYQKQLDKAESDLTGLVVENLADPSEKNSMGVSDARDVRDALLKQYKQAVEDLRIIPQATKLLNTKIRALQQQRESEIAILVQKTLPKKKKGLEDKARLAIAKLAAHLIMLGSRDIDASTCANMLAYLSEGSSLEALMHEEFHKLENQLGVAKI